MPTTTARVIVRHSRVCPKRSEGPHYRECRCPKAIVAYDGTKRDKNGHFGNRLISCRTRSWTAAEDFAKKWLESFDPRLQKLARLEAAQERSETTIEKAVGLHLKQLTTQRLAHGTLANVKIVLGDVHPDTCQVTSPGHLFTWLDRQFPRPTFISQVTSTHLINWTATWQFMDTTHGKYWNVVTTFFRFCKDQQWIENSPTKGLKPPRVAEGNRTAIFTQKQYENILDAVKRYDPDNVPKLTRKHWQQRLTSFIQLMRWTGQDLIDAVQFSPAQLDSDAVVRYTRQKTRKKATIPIPPDVAALLRDVPLERDSEGPNHPFRHTSCTVGSDTRTWSRRLEEVFKLAGITSVRTDLRDRPPHSKMLRDSFAVWHLTHGAKLLTVSKMLGHSNTKTTEKHYLPWVKELEDAHIEDARQALSKIPKRKAGRVVSIAG